MIPQSNPPPSILTALSIVIVIFISVIFFSILASFSLIIIFFCVLFQYLIGPTKLEGHHLDLEVRERNQNQSRTMQTRILVSHQSRHGGDVSIVWREGLERATTGTRMSSGSSEAAAKCIGCAICLEDFEKGEACQTFVVCKHIFHYSCIQHWLNQNMTCPICRSSIVDPKC